MIDQDTYYAHGDLAATGSVAEETYIDFGLDTNGNITLYLWPVPSLPTVSNLEIKLAIPFSLWTLGGNYFIPPGYQDAIQWVLAFKCLPMFGFAVTGEVAKLVTDNGLKSEARIREMNVLNRKLTIPAVVSPEIQTSPQAAQAALQAR